MAPAWKSSATITATVADWFDPRVGGHATLDRTTSGAIYRIAPKGFKPKVPKFNLNTTAGQIAALKSPAQNVRAAGFYRLKAQGGKAVRAVSALLKDENPYLAARAVWLLAQMGPQGLARVTPLLASKDETTRLTAFRALRVATRVNTWEANHDFLSMATRLAKDPSPAVRREVAVSLRDVPLAQRRDILVDVARRYDGKDRTYLEALGTGCTGYETELFDAVANALGGSSGNWNPALARIAWRLSSPKAVDGFKARAAKSALPTEERKLALNGLAFVKSQSATDAMLSLAATPDFSYRADSTWWLFNRKNNYWKDYEVLAEMQKRGLYNPEAQEFISVTVPEPSSEPSKLPPIEKILELKGDPKRGQRIAVACATCHQIGLSAGADLGPDLTAFGKTQTREVILRSILEPSAEISQGYDGSEIVTKSNVTIHGVVLASGDPVIIKSQGGVVQTIPRGQIARQRRLNRSLMLSAEQMGLAAQDIADIAAYLQSNLIPSD